MSVILEVDIEYVANFGSEGFGAGLFVIAFHVVAPVDFVDFASGGTGGGNLKVAGQR